MRQVATNSVRRLSWEVIMRHAKEHSCETPSAARYKSAKCNPTAFLVRKREQMPCHNKCEVQKLISSEFDECCDSTEQYIWMYYYQVYYQVAIKSGWIPNWLNQVPWIPRQKKQILHRLPELMNADECDDSTSGVD